MPKLRCCDDARSSGTNDHTRMAEAVFYPSFEFPARVGAAVFDRCRQMGRSRPELLFGLDDLFAAYRRVPSSQPRFTVVALYDFDLDEVVYHDLFGMNFGLRSAPVQFSRVPQFIVCVARCLLAVPVDHYVDDYMLVDIAGAGLWSSVGGESTWWPSSGQWSLDQLHTLIGFQLEPKKRKHGALSNEGLGVMCDLSLFQSQSEISFSPTSRRVEEILAALRSAQSRRRLSPHEAQVASHRKEDKAHIAAQLGDTQGRALAIHGRHLRLDQVDMPRLHDLKPLPRDRNTPSMLHLQLFLASDLCLRCFNFFFAVLPAHPRRTAERLGHADTPRLRHRGVRK